MKAHERLVEAASAAIDKLFGDRSVPKSTTREALEELRDDIDTMIALLEAVPPSGGGARGDGGLGARKGPLRGAQGPNVARCRKTLEV